MQAVFGEAIYLKLQVDKLYRFQIAPTGRSMKSSTYASLQAAPPADSSVKC